MAQRLLPRDRGAVEGQPVAALVRDPASLLHARITRLISCCEKNQIEENRIPVHSHSLWYGVAAALAAVAVFTLTYGRLLVRVHTVTEWLIR